MIRKLCVLFFIVPVFSSYVSVASEQDRPALVADKDLLNDLEKSIFFFQLDHALAEKIVLLEKIKHKESRNIVGCSIKNNVILLKSYVDLDLPNILKLAESMEAINRMTDSRWNWFKNKSGLFALECYPLDSYWEELTKSGQ